MCRRPLPYLHNRMLLVFSPIKLRLSCVFVCVCVFFSIHRCCGADEFLKLYAYTLMEYHRVMHLDVDTFVLHSMDELMGEEGREGWIDPRRKLLSNFYIFFFLINGVRRSFGRSWQCSLETAPTFM